MSDYRPVKPSEARARRATEDIDYQSALKRINDYLSSREPNAFGEWWFDVSDMPTPLVIRLAYQFGVSGWSVRRDYDQRDGSALVFKERV